MTFKIEDGTGVALANAYISVVEFQAYHNDRGTDIADFDTTEIQQAVVKATDFIEQRWGARFMGAHEFSDISSARATLTLASQPLATETVTINTAVFTFGSNVTIGASVSATIDNLVAAVADSAVKASAELGDTMLVVATAKGTPGNSIAVSTNATGASWSSATLTGGGDVREPQALSFPRRNLFDREGRVVLGIPAKLKSATSEYAFRALSINLMPDPVIDSTGRAVVGKREKVGPIEEETRYAEGADISNLLRPYPAADRLLSEYVTGTGRVNRG